MHMSKIKEVIIDREKCVGIAACLALAPGAFTLDDENKAIYHPDHNHTDEELIDAAKSCPVDAIILKDEDGNQIHP